MLAHRFREEMQGHLGELLGALLADVMLDRFRADDGQPVHALEVCSFALSPVETTLVKALAETLFGQERVPAFRFLIRAGIVTMLEEMDEPERKAIVRAWAKYYCGDWGPDTSDHHGMVA